MIIQRTFNSHLINSILNDPSIFPMVTMDGIDKLDVSILIDDENYFLVVYHEGNIIGLLMLIKQGEMKYELHTNMLPNGRGRVAFEVFKGLKEYISGKVRTLTTMVPIDNRPADWITKKVGFKFVEERTIGFIRNGIDVPLKFYSMEI